MSLTPSPPASGSSATRPGAPCRRPASRLAAAALAGALAIGGILTATGTLPAHAQEAGAIRVDSPWARATPPGAKVAGGFATITNGGDRPDRLVSATADIAGRVEIHEMAVTDGVMTMRPLPDGVAVPAGATVALEPGSYHLMLMELSAPLKSGERIPGTLTFEQAGTVAVEFDVQPIGAKAPAHHAPH